MLYPKSAILGLSFLDPKDLCLPNQFSKAYCQYILNLMSKKKLGSFNDWIKAYLQSFIRLPLHHNIWTFSGQHLFQSFLSISEQNSANLGRTSGKHYEAMTTFGCPLTDLSGANIGFHSNSRDWLFLVLMMSKINPLMNKSALFWQDV